MILALPGGGTTHAQVFSRSSTAYCAPSQDYFMLRYDVILDHGKNIKGKCLQF